MILNIFIRLMRIVLTLMIIIGIIGLIYKYNKIYHREKIYKRIYEISKYKNKNGSFKVPFAIIENANTFISNLKLKNIPSSYFEGLYFINLTFKNTISFRWKVNDGSYLYFEIFKNKIECTLIPYGDYNTAIYYEFPITNTILDLKESEFPITIFNYKKINTIISNFLKNKYVS